uniref:Putative ovule protein n=1 Tax=Solanum chacoense TaxID=4108 RepID=A0A0V0GYB3_SOLCH
MLLLSYKVHKIQYFIEIRFLRVIFILFDAIYLGSTLTQTKVSYIPLMRSLTFTTWLTFWEEEQVCCQPFTLACPSVPKAIPTSQYLSLGGRLALRWMHYQLI